MTVFSGDPLEVSWSVWKKYKLLLLNNKRFLNPKKNSLGNKGKKYKVMKHIKKTESVNLPKLKIYILKGSDILIRYFFQILVGILISASLHAQLQPAHIFNNNMVLQRNKPVKIWGWASPREQVKAEFAGQTKSTVTTDKGDWVLYLDPMAASSKPRELKILDSTSSVIFNNILVGDVWVLGGQSNMELDLFRIYQGNTEIVSANFPEIRLMTIPRAAGLEPVRDFKPLNEYDN